jgi:hypothetical protein
MDKKLAAVTVLYESNARQIPEMMRKLANEIEAPPMPSNVNQVLVIARDAKTGQMNVYAWGDIEIDNSISMLVQAQVRLADCADKGSLWKIPQGGSTPKDSA